jgi:hypothetical protein
METPRTSIKSSSAGKLNSAFIHVQIIAMPLSRVASNVCWAQPGSTAVSSEHPSSNPTNSDPIRQWDGAMPILMSMAVLLMVVVELFQHGPHAPHHDENTSDHIAIMLMFGQVPIMFWFVAMRRQSVRRILPTLAIQLVLWSVTFASAVTLT